MTDTIPPVVDKENLTVRVEKELRDRLAAAAARDDRSIAYVVRRLLVRGLDQDDAEHAREGQ